MHQLTPVRLALAAVLVLSAPASAGVYYEATTTIDAPQGGQDMTMRVTGWAEGPNAKVVFTESDNPLMTEGSYLLATGDGTTVYLVDPEAKTYMAWDVSALAGGFGAMMQAMGGMVKIEVSDPKVEKLVEEAGPAMLGHPTTHYRSRMSYALTMKIFGSAQTSTSSTVQDTWATTAVDVEGLGVWLRSDSVRTGIESVDELIETQMAATVAGFPLKTVAVTTTVDQQGTESTSTTTMEVTTLREESVPAAQFQLPAGYERTEMPDLTQVMGGRGR